MDSSLANLSVTVIITSFNRAHLLEQTIPSYLKNDCVKELVLVDDGSSDNTEEVVNQLQRLFSQIKYVKLEKNSSNLLLIILVLMLQLMSSYILVMMIVLCYQTL